MCAGSGVLVWDGHFTFYPQVDVLFHAVYVHLFLSYLSGSLEVKDEGT